jgi:hypothetical protein
MVDCLRPFTAADPVFHCRPMGDAKRRQVLKRRIALLCLRMVRWLAPELLNNRLQSLNEMRQRIGFLREWLSELPGKQLQGATARMRMKELQDLESVYKSAEKFGSQRYEMVKIEVRKENTLTRAGMARVRAGEDHIVVLNEERKRKLFEGVAAGLAQSAEIEKFIYFREYGEIKTVGIHLYLKHD